MGHQFVGNRAQFLKADAFRSVQIPVFFKWPHKAGAEALRQFPGRGVSATNVKPLGQWRTAIENQGT